MEFIKQFLSNIFGHLFKLETRAPLAIEIRQIPLLGDKGDDVKSLQIQLNEYGSGLMLDGVFGPKTQKAVSDFQKLKGLPGSGVIGPKTLEFLNLELVVADSGPVHEAVWIIAQGELGQKEIAGAQHNPRILEYHETTGGFGDDETPWCSSFCNWVLKESGTGIKGTNSAAARSWMNWGVATNNPQKGDVVVFWRGKRDGWQGHVAFYSYETPTHVYVLGGNQSNAVSVAPYSKNQLLGYRTYT